MATTRERLIDWLADLPDNTEIGIEDIYLVAMVDQRAQQFLVGDLSDERKLARKHIAGTSGTARELWKILEPQCANAANVG